MSSIAGQAQVKVSHAEYHGWKDALILSNGVAEIAVLPAIGHNDFRMRRLLHVSFVSTSFLLCLLSLALWMVSCIRTPFHSYAAFDQRGLRAGP